MTRSFVVALALLLVIPEPPPAGLLAREPNMAGVRMLYGPDDGFDSVDQHLINGAQRSIDMAAYVLSDRQVVDALARAALRGVKVRVYLDGDEMRGGSPIRQFTGVPNIEARIKEPGRDLMHLKSYQVDGKLLRSGSANFSISATAYQDNDIIVIDSPLAAARFRAVFERLWARPGNRRIGAR